MANLLRSKLKYYYQKFYNKFNYDTQKVLLNLGNLQAKLNNSKKEISSFDEVEFQVFSQRGEDGILQYLTSNVEIPNKVFVEFGVETYTESNTRFLLMNNNWSGLVIDGSPENIRYIKSDFIYWKYDITAIQSFITKDNIDGLISKNITQRDIGLLSVDIDGNDYWVWEAITSINPRIVICEYNSMFGPDKAVTIPYKSSFVRSQEHFSDLYFGASLAAFCHLAEKKGYDFVGTASSGVNAFFVRKDLSAPFRKFTPSQGFRESANRDSRDRDGSLTFLKHSKRLDVVKDFPVYDVVNNRQTTIREMFAL
jgi:hypothetical protein